MNCCYSDDDDDGGSGGGCCRWRITGVKYNRSDKLSLPVLEHVRVCVWACAFWGLGLEKGSEKIFVWGPIFGRYHSNVHWLFDMHVFSLMYGVPCVFFACSFLGCYFPPYTEPACVQRKKRNCRLTLITKDLLYMENYTEQENRTITRQTEKETDSVDWKWNWNWETETHTSN